MPDPIVPRSHIVALIVGADNAYNATDLFPVTVTASNLTDFDGYGIFVDDRTSSQIFGNTNPKLFSREEAIEWYYKATGIRWNGTTLNFPLQGFNNRKHENVETQLVTSDGSKFYNLTYQNNITSGNDAFAGVSPAFTYCPNIGGNKKYVAHYYFQERTDWGQRATGVSDFYQIGSIRFSKAISTITLSSNDVNQTTASSRVISGEFQADFTLSLANSGFINFERESFLSTDPDELNNKNTGATYIPAYGTYGGPHASLQDFQDARDDFIANTSTVGSIENDSPIVIPGMQRLVRSFNGVTYYQYYHAVGDWVDNPPEHKLVDN